MTRKKFKSLLVVRDSEAGQQYIECLACQRTADFDELVRASAQYKGISALLDVAIKLLKGLDK